MSAAPRELEQRAQDARSRLADDVDLWVATSGAAGPHLVPLSHLWDGSRILVSTARSTVTARNLVLDGRVRLALGQTRDVVVVDGTAELVKPADLEPAAGDAFAAATGFDPRRLAQPYVYFWVRPWRIQAWREENEIGGRDVMRDGGWLA
ncbi:pyridoxamine 5'-phosphate oxidase family protein [Cellulomonas bogoriensis]|uniref:Pyridoxamine 5'-phosphate oxidase n=1 Tax=Cellulomonas bogoriensis 69B4 = DSM 16987 TaxID=1386082 RepID=A0A0A0C2X6_9CELL|nr:pyridoxamine 5'-phosphate oxidase family protein [Cellulomonas bogoriensis]KGM13694.1 pyridoxamine 5'-phosphate oxidase [Cellulomonas bogoriensis 69B4 = DSM 16987]